jgi:hypothetical protein
LLAQTSIWRSTTVPSEAANRFSATYIVVVDNNSMMNEIRYDHIAKDSEQC